LAVSCRRASPAARTPSAAAIHVDGPRGHPFDPEDLREPPERHGGQAERAQQDRRDVRARLGRQPDDEQAAEDVAAPAVARCAPSLHPIRSCSSATSAARTTTPAATWSPRNGSTRST
jgi:hypothetical protein